MLALSNADLSTDALPSGFSRDSSGHVRVEVDNGVILETKTSAKKAGEVYFRTPSGEIYELGTKYMQVIGIMRLVS